jgi:hypothetical protein
MIEIIFFRTVAFRDYDFWIRAVVTTWRPDDGDLMIETAARSRDWNIFVPVGNK